MPPDTLLWVLLKFKLGKVPALIDTGAQFSCIRADVIEYIFLRGEHCVLSTCALTCLLAEGSKGRATNVATLHVGLLDYTWNHVFKVLNGRPFPIILGIDFLHRIQMKVDVDSRTYSFSFAPGNVGTFSSASSEAGEEPFFQELGADMCNLTTVAETRPKGLGWDSLKVEFSPFSLLYWAQQNAFLMTLTFQILPQFGPHLTGVRLRK